MMMNAGHEPKLAPPGAGLPKLELFMEAVMLVPAAAGHFNFPQNNSKRLWICLVS